jgi:hypothetical protein
MRTALRFVASVVSGLLLLVPLGEAYGAVGLPVYHSWGLMHGSFTTAIPALVAAVFVALGLIPWFGKSDDVLPRLISCVSVLALVTTLFWVDQRSQYTLSVWHLVLYIALFALFSLLCLVAKRPFLVPLFLLGPLLVDPVFGLLLTVRYDSPIALRIFDDELLHKLMPAVAATVLAVVVARLLRAREAY